MRAPVRFSSVALAAVAVFAFTALYVSDRELARSPAMAPLRYGLWAVGAGTLIALTLALVHERRLTRRVAERSAELERLSAELLRANRAKSEFLANVSHELRTPLNAIVGFVDLLRDGVYGELQPRQVWPVQRIEASAMHLRHLVDQVLDLAKMTAGRMEVHTESIDLRPFVLDAATEVEPLASERGLTVSMAIPALLPRLRTDPSHLRQVLMNLLSNAVKYTAEGGIVVRGRVVTGDEAVPPGLPPDGYWLALSVIDTGIGIGPDDRERIFDEFEQVNAGPRGDSVRRGTGLGLSISRRLARLIGGEITVESELGRGSTFTVWLPVDPVDAKNALLRASGQIAAIGELTATASANASSRRGL
jgi:signal transduction histidine kinase